MSWRRFPGLVPRYESVKEVERRFGRSHFLEVSRKRLIEPNAATEFIFVARGYVDGDDERKWIRFVTLPDDPEMKAWLAKALQEV